MYKKSAVELLRLIKKRELGIEELTRLYLERIEKIDRGEGGLNSVGEIIDNALVKAREMDSQKDRSAPLFGLPILIKDNIDVAGLHTTSGSLALADNRAERDADIVSNLRRRGAFIFGKTHMTEFANYMAENMPGGYSSLGGQVLHAYDAKINPGGSSSGSGVAVSAGLCAAAIGTDTSFSIVGCAVINGITGLKPAHGALPMRGIIPICHTLDMAGPMTKNLSDALAVYSGMRNTPLEEIRPMKSENMRFAVNIHDRDKVLPEKMGMIRELLEDLKRDGVFIGEVNHPDTPMEETIMLYEFRHDLEKYLSSSLAKRKTLREIISFNDEDPQRRAKYGQKYLIETLEDASGRMDEPEYHQVCAQRKEVRDKIVASLDTYDICLMSGRTAAMHFAGLPSIAFPLGINREGAPEGIILYGKDERELISAALTIETYLKPIHLPKL